MASTTFSGPVTSQNGFIGSVNASGYTVQIPSALLAGLPSAATAGQILYVSNANAGVGTVCFSNGTNWIDIKTGLAVA